MVRLFVARYTGPPDEGVKNYLALGMALGRYSRDNGFLLAVSDDGSELLSDRVTVEISYDINATGHSDNLHEICADGEPDAIEECRKAIEELYRSHDFSISE